MTTNKIPRICSVDGCAGKHDGHGFCAKHRQRWFKHGDPFKVRLVLGHPEKRFWNKVKKTDSCWLWTGSSRNSYGCLSLNGKTVSAHRYSFWLHNGYWPMPFCLHSCDIKLCVNPSHLRAGTPQDNTQDAVLRGLHPRGEKQGTSKLTECDVRVMIEMFAAGYGQAAVAKRFNISKSVAHAIKTGQTWRHITNL